MTKYAEVLIVGIGKENITPTIAVDVGHGDALHVEGSTDINAVAKGARDDPSSIGKNWIEGFCGLADESCRAVDYGQGPVGGTDGDGHLKFCSGCRDNRTLDRTKMHYVGGRHWVKVVAG